MNNARTMDLALTGGESIGTLNKVEIVSTHNKALESTINGTHDTVTVK